MNKYEPFENHLRHANAARVAMSFRQIERVLGKPLPPSSRSHRAWWSNNPTNNVMTKAWLKAGYKTESVDLVAEKLVFKRIDKENSRPVGDIEKKPRRHPLFGCLAGTVTIPDDLDLTQPADPEWGKVYE